MANTVTSVVLLLLNKIIKQRNSENIGKTADCFKLWVMCPVLGKVMKINGKAVRIPKGAY